MAKTRKRSRRPVLRKYVELALAGGATEAKLLPANLVIAADWVRLKCQFGCPGYNKRLCCPPYTPTPEQTRRVLRDYRRTLIYAYSGPRNLRRRRKMTRDLAAIERTAFLDGYYKALAFGSGPCKLCTECDTSRRCKYPDIARPAMEAAGIDVFATCRSAGIELDVVTDHSQIAKYVSLVLID